MATADQIRADIAKLDEALSSGAEELTFTDGKRVRFRAIDDLLRAKSAKQQELAGLTSNGGGIVRTYKFTSDKDL